MSHAAVYLMRSASGAAIRRMRFVHARSGSEWAAPTNSQTPAAIMQAAAAWIAQQLTSVPGDPQLTLVLDLDGSRCNWLTTPSPDEDTVVATLANASVQREAGGGEDDSTSVSWLGSHSLNEDLSVQPLAAPPAKRQRFKRGGENGSVENHRIAVLATADLSARLLMDELDKLTITPARVVSLWHIMHEAWHGEEGALRGRTQSGNAAATATVVVDPEGRLCWSWSGPTGLIAGGSMRLRKSDMNSGPSETAAEEGGQLASASNNSTASIIEVTRSDVGRLVTEWISWSSQLGIAPSRLSCIGPTSLTSSGLDDDLPLTPSIAALGQTLGRVWPGTIVEAQVDDDPIFATLRKSVIAANDLGLPGVDAKDAAPESQDGRLGLLELSRRPGRASRKVFLWNFVLLVVAAIVIIVLGVRLQQVAHTLEAQALARDASIKPLLESVKDLAPKAIGDPDPAVVLATRLKTLQDERKAIQFEKPVLAEFFNVIHALDGVEGELTSLNISSLVVPLLSMQFADSDSGGTLKARMDAMPAGSPWLKWSGERSSPAPKPDANGKSYRVFTIVGNWKDGEKPGTKSGGFPLQPRTPPTPPAPPATPSSEPTGTEEHSAAKPTDKPLDKPAEPTSASTPAAAPPSGTPGEHPANPPKSPPGKGGGA